jgi:hypothetical protein
MEVVKETDVLNEVRRPGRCFVRAIRMRDVNCTIRDP